MSTETQVTRSNFIRLNNKCAVSEPALSSYSVRNGISTLTVLTPQHITKNR